MDEEDIQEIKDLLKGQGSSFFSARSTQLTNASSVVVPKGVPFLNELIQNADDRNAKGIYLIFTEEALYITNDGETFNFNEKRAANGEAFAGDLFNINSVAKKVAGRTEEDRAGRYGTGFELIYGIGNRFEIHWRDRYFQEEGKGGRDGRISARSNPELLEKGDKNTWDIEGFEKLISPFDTDDRAETHRGVLFRSEWRTEADKEAKYGEYEDLFRDSEFSSWDLESKREYYDNTCNYAPFLIQFCKSIQNLTLIWCDGKNSEIYEARRSHCYATNNYSGLEAGKFSTEIVQLEISKASFSMRSGDDPLDPRFFDRSLLVVEPEIIQLFHGWCSVQGGNRGNNPEIDVNKRMESWKRPDTRLIHAHDTHSCENCPQYDKTDWMPDRTSIVHIHFPIDDISENLDKLMDSGKTLLHSILPLGVSTHNRFMISADLYVLENRKQCESDGDKRVWNSDCTRTSFWLHSQVFEELSHFEQFSNPPELDTMEMAMIQALPTEINEWWPTSVGIDQSGFPSSDDLLNGKNDPSYSPYKGLCSVSWILDTNGKFCKPNEVIIPTNSTNDYDENLALVLKQMGLNVMRKPTFNHIMSDESYVIEELRRLLRDRRVYEITLDESLKTTIIKEANSQDWNNLSLESKISLARLVNHIDSDFSGAVFPDEEGVMRNKAEYSTIPEHLNVIIEIQGKRKSIHPELDDINVGEATAKDVLIIIENLQKSNDSRFFELDNDFIEKMARLADQIINDDDVSQNDLVKHNFIPCRIGDRVFFTGNHHHIRCPECNSLNAPLLGINGQCTNCEEALYWNDVEHREITKPGRTDYQYSRTHIFSPDGLNEQDIPECVKKRIVTAISGTHFTDKLEATTKGNLMRFLGKNSVIGSKKNCYRLSLFDQDELEFWLGLEGHEYNDESIHETRLEFLFQIRDYLESAKGASAIDGSFSDAPIFVDEQGEWAKAKEFVLYIDETTLELLNSREDSDNIRVPHPDIIRSNRDENKWMLTTQLGGAKENVEFDHIERSIRGLIGEGLESYSEKPEIRFKKLAKIAMHIIKNPELLEDKSDYFDDLEWVPIGNQDGFEEEEDGLCRWSEFPLPGDIFNQYWGENTHNPHITLNGKMVSPHDFFDEEDLTWVREQDSADLLRKLGTKPRPSAERMFLCLIDRDGASKEGISSQLYELFAELQGTIPETYKLQSYRFYHPENNNWLSLGDETILVENENDVEIVGGDCISLESLDAGTQTFLKSFGNLADMEEAHGASKAIARISEKWDDWSIVEKASGVDTLKRLWKTYHDDDDYSEMIVEPGDSVIFPLGKDGVRVEELVVVDSSSNKLHRFKDRCSIYTSKELAQKDDSLLGLNRTPTKSMLFQHGATIWCSEDGDEMATGFTFEEHLERMIDSSIKIADELWSGSEVSEEEGYDWNAAMMGIANWYSESDRSCSVPLAYWRHAKLVVDNPDNEEGEVYFVSSNDPERQLSQRFKMEGLALLHITGDEEEYIAEIPNRSETDGPFPSFHSCLETANRDLADSDLDIFSPLSEYIKDILKALEHRFTTRPDGENPLSFLGELIISHRTGKMLTEEVTVGSVTISGSTNKNWLVNVEFSDPPVWPEIRVIFWNNMKEAKRKELVKDVLISGLKVRLDRTTDDAAIEDRKWLAEALGFEEWASAGVMEIYEIVAPLLESPNPLSWSEIPGFEEIWNDSSPSLNGELVLNPDVSKAREKIVDWYNDIGCQICGQLTPNGPGRTTYEESRVQIFKTQQTPYIWRTATERGGTVGNWLYLCPTHHRLFAKKCLELFVLADEEWKEIRILSEEVKSGDLQEILDSIDSKRISARCYERRGHEDSYEEVQEGAEWSERREIERIKSAHAKKILEQVKEYLRDQFS